MYGNERVLHNCKIMMNLELQEVNKAVASDKTGPRYSLRDIQVEVLSLSTFENKSTFHSGRFIATEDR